MTLRFGIRPGCDSRGKKTKIPGIWHSKSLRNYVIIIVIIAF